MAGTPNVTSASPKIVLMVIANPSTSTTLGWPVGYWGAELTHAWLAFTETGYEVAVASPDGGACELDGLSDPRDESGYSSWDLITMGFVNTPSLAELTANTPKLADLDLDEFDAKSSSVASRRCSRSARTKICRPRSARSTRRRSRPRPCATVSPR